MSIFNNLKNINRRAKFETEAFLSLRQYCEINLEKLPVMEQGKQTDAVFKVSDEMFGSVNEYEFTLVYMSFLASVTKEVPQAFDQLKTGSKAYINAMHKEMRDDVIGLARHTFGY